MAKGKCSTGVEKKINANQLKQLSLNNYTKSIDGNFYICKACRNALKKNIIPSCNEKKYKFLIDNLSGDLLVAGKSLSKLEAHLLKLVIHFIRIGQVPGYGGFKIKGPMITVEADVKKTLNEKILPRQQELIPVALKRKFTYKANVMEEIVSKSKIRSYFNYFKENNLLFQNEELMDKRIDEWIETMRGNCPDEQLNEQRIYESTQSMGGNCQDCENEKVHICPLDDIEDIETVNDVNS